MTSHEDNVLLWLTSRYAVWTENGTPRNGTVRLTARRRGSKNRIPPKHWGLKRDPHMSPRICRDNTSPTFHTPPNQPQTTPRHSKKTRHHTPHQPRNDTQLYSGHGVAKCAPRGGVGGRPFAHFSPMPTVEVCVARGWWSLGNGLG